MKKIIASIFILLMGLLILNGCNNLSKKPLEMQEPQVLGDKDFKQGSTFTFTRADLKIENGQKTIGMYIPLNFNREVDGITQNLECTATEDGVNTLVKFDPLEETGREIRSMSGEFNFRVDTLFGSNDGSVVLNTGSSTGVRQEGIRILKAPKGSGAELYYYFSNDLGRDLQITCKANIISEDPIFSTSKEFTIEYYKAPLTGTNVSLEMMELGDIGVDHGTILPSGDIQFKHEDLISGEGLYFANVNLEVLVNEPIKDVDFNLECMDPYTNEEIIPPLKEDNDIFRFLEQGFDIDGRATISGTSDVIFNSGGSQGTKIIEAGRGDDLIIGLQFYFGDLKDSQSMNCNVILKPREPNRVFRIPLNIQYIK